MAAVRYKPGDVVFWHDPDCNVGSGVGRVVACRDDMLALAMLSGSEAEVPPHEVTPVHDCDVVGVEEHGFLLYYDADNNTTYTDGLTTEEIENDTLSEEELRRVAASKESGSG